MNEILKKIKLNLRSVIQGKEEEIDLVLTGFVAGGHLLLEDVPGVGKTTIAKALALSINSEFNRIQFTPDLLPADILGGSIYNAKEGTFDFRKGPIFGNIILSDEINRASPRTQSSLLECMSEGQVSIEGKTYQLQKPFMVIATQNPIDFHGTYPLPEAQMDRFAMLIHIGYPSPEAELTILESQKKDHPIDYLKPVASSKDISDLQESITEVYIDPTIASYIVNLVQKTRSDPRIKLGLSPRASLTMFRCAQSRAFINERDHVIPDDIKQLAPHIFPHRIILDYKALSSKMSKMDIIQNILDETKVPV